MNISSTWLNWCREYKKYPYTETIELTHNLFVDEKNKLTNKFLGSDIIKKVAKKRGVNQETIERQMIILIVKGLIDIFEIVKKEAYDEIVLVLENEDIVKLSEIKNKINESISWFEIKAVIASFGVEAK